MLLYIINIRLPKAIPENFKALKLNLFESNLIRNDCQGTHPHFGQTKVQIELALNSKKLEKKSYLEKQITELFEMLHLIVE